MLDCSTVPSPKGTPLPEQGTQSLLTALTIQSSPSSYTSGSPERRVLISYFLMGNTIPFCKMAVCCLHCFLCRSLSLPSPLTSMHTFCLCNIIKINKKEDKLKQRASSFPPHLTFPGSVFFEPFCHYVAVLYTTQKKCMYLMLILKQCMLKSSN